MKKERQSGFSLIELLIVVAIVGIIAAMAIPFLQKALRAAENGNTFATLRTISSSQLGYFQQNGRFGRITEINNVLSNSIGTPSGTQVTRGKFVLTHTNPTTPTDADLRAGYTILATRQVTGEGQIYQYEINQTGEIKQLQP